MFVHIADDDTREWFEEVLAEQPELLIGRIKSEAIDGLKPVITRVYRRSISDILLSIKRQGGNE